MTRTPCLFAIGTALLLIAADAPKPVWTDDLAKMKVPDSAAAGKIQGADFKMEKAAFDSFVSTISLRQGKDFLPDAELLIFLFLKKDESLEKKTFEIAAKSKFGVQSPHVYIKRTLADQKVPKTLSYTDKYVMKLEFGAKKDGKIPGKIYVCLPDKDKSFVAGTFSVEVK